MQIEVKRRFGTTIIVTDLNVRIEQDAETRIYGKKPDGTVDYSNRTDDIDMQWLSMFDNVLAELIYYRKGDYDSSSLILSLFEKLPKEKNTELLKKLNELYEGEDNE